MDGSKPRQINFRLPEADAQRLDMLAVADHRSTPDYVRSVVLSFCFPGAVVKTPNEGPPVEAHPIEDVRAPVTSRPVAQTDRGPSSEKRATRAKERGTESPRATAPIPAGRREVVTHWKGGKS